MLNLYSCGERDVHYGGLPWFREPKDSEHLLNVTPKTVLQHVGYSDDELLYQEKRNIDDMYGRQERGLTGHLTVLSHGKNPATCELRNDETYRHDPLPSTNEPTLFLDSLFSSTPYLLAHECPKRETHQDAGDNRPFTRKRTMTPHRDGIGIIMIGVREGRPGKRGSIPRSA